MAIKITTRGYPHVDLVEVAGLVDCATAPQLARVLQRLIGAGRCRLVVDLAECDFASVAFWKVSEEAAVQCRKFRRGDLRLSALPLRARRSGRLVGYTEVLEIFDSAVDAVGSFT